MPVITKCEICGKEISGPPSRPKRFCSKECMNIGLSKMKNQGCEKICTVCGQSYHIKPSKKDESKYCSRECRHIGLSGKGEYKLDLDLNEIKRLYLEELMPAQEIADRMGTLKKNILARLHNMGVELRDKGSGKRIYYEKNPDKNPNNLPGVKEKQSNIQIKMNIENPDYPKKRRAGVKLYHQNISPEVKENWIKNVTIGMNNMSPEAKREKMIKQYATKRKNGTFKCNGLEKRYEAILIRDDVTYLPQYTIPEGDMLYRYDFYLPDSNTLVEVNGTGTHADPRKYNKDDLVVLGIPGWVVRTAGEIWEEDRRKREYAEERGYTVLTVWQKEL